MSEPECKAKPRPAIEMTGDVHIDSTDIASVARAG